MNLRKLGWMRVVVGAVILYLAVCVIAGSQGSSPQISPHIVNTLFIGRHPRAVAAHPNKDVVYVSLEKRIAVIDARSQMLVESFGAGYPDKLEISPDGRFLFVGNWPDTVWIIDTNTNATVAKVKVGKDPAGMAMTPDGRLLYVANNDDASVSVIHIPRGYELPRVIATIGEIPWPRGVCASSDGRRVYVASTIEGETNSVTVIDADSQTVLTTFTVPDATTDCAVTPDGRYLYVSMDPDVRATPGGVAVVDTMTYEVIADIRTGKAGFREHVVYGVGGIDITSDGDFVFVVNAVENTVSAIDTETNEIVSTLSDPMFGSEPLGLAITPDNKWVYVANYKSNSISVIDTGYAAR